MSSSVWYHAEGGVLFCSFLAMGESIIVNSDGSLSQSKRKTIGNIDWIDIKQFKGRWSVLQIIWIILLCIPIYGWVVGILFFLVFRIIKGFWPYFGICAIENTSNPFKIYCNKKGDLGLYTKKRRITPAKFRSIQQLSSNDYPIFIMERKDKCCLYNYIKNKFLFKDSESISLGSDNTIYVESKGKKAKYSPIGMCIDDKTE